MSKKGFILGKCMVGCAVDRRENSRSPLFTPMNALPRRSDKFIGGDAKAAQGPQTASHDKTFPDRRAKLPPLFTKALRIRKNGTKNRAGLSSEMEAQLREANEHLVVATVKAHRMIEDVERTTVQLSYMAQHDPLTGLPNRALLTDRLAQAITLASRHGNKVALMFIDLDNFKRINDSMGHTVGDKLLQSVAKRLQANVRHSDTVSRQGGDEFVVLLSEVEDAQSAVLSAEKLIESVGQPHLIGGHQLLVTVSIGISLYPEDGVDAEMLMKNADTAMYHAKRAGRNNCKVYTPTMNNRSVMRKSVEQALQHGLNEHKFVVYYQPKLNLATGVITGAEALLRWQRSDHSLNCPTQFIRIAEDCGLILPIGQWVIREACRQTQAWLRNGFNLGHIAVNVSAVEFHDKNFLSSIRAILDDTGLDPHHLEIELTENALSQDAQQTLPTLYALRSLGIRIAVDDFGTGYTSLSFLRDFPIDTLKIDQSFVQDTSGGPGKDMVAILIAMGKGFNQRIVAEGIETQQQLAFLQTQQCAEGQGYYFGRPMTAEAVRTLLVTERNKKSVAS